MTLPAPVDGARWRPLEPGDAAALFEFGLAVEASDRFGWLETREEWEAEFKNPEVDWPGDSLALFGPGGAIRAAGIVFYSRNETKQRNYLWGHVHPTYRRRGIGRQLLSWQLRRSAVRSPDDGSERLARVHVLERHEDRRRLAESLGFTFNRFFVDMCLPTSRPIGSVELPSGLRLQPWAEDLDERTRLATNAAFADHWGSLPRSPEVWKLRHGDHPHFRPDLSFLAVEDDEVVSVSLCWVDAAHNAANDASEAWIGTVGTVRRWRRRGVASALIRASVEAMAGAGLAEAWLGVDTEGTTGALSVYEKLGFTEQRRERAYVYEL